MVWEFTVPVQRAAAFEAAYGPDGPWAHLFGRAAGFVGLDLLRCVDHAGKYLTIDRWKSLAAFETFKQTFAADYQILDAQLEGLASTEMRVGAFDECIVASA